MNQNLQKISDYIQQAENLSAEEKASLAKAVKDTDSALTISEFKLERTEKVKRTTAILLEETIEELEQKRKSVEAQNRELEIETALEKVRTVAMSMRQPDDMLKVCQIISDQLQQLNVQDIRNVQTAIIYESKGTYLNYEYYVKHDKQLVTEVDFKNHELQNLFANKMLQGAEELFHESMNGKKVQEWYEYQKTTNQYADSYLENAPSLNYYFYSLGPVALGISTYSPLSEAGINLFKRFRNVFDLAYRRFLDIEKAEAQAKEARIETSLERVRAQAMSMRKPEDLTDICEVLFAELQSLGFSEMRNAMINIHDDEKASFVNYDYSDEIGKSINHLDYTIHPLIEKQIKQVRSADGFSETSFIGKDLKDWIAFRKKIGEKDDPRIENTDALYYYFYSIGNGSIGISTFSSITEEKLDVLKRFRNVFNLSYQRYTDIALAEAQAREAQIELGLERVRARAMAMQNSNELAELVATLFKELTRLDFALTRCYIYIIDPETLSLRAWTFNTEVDEIPESYKIQYLNLPYYKALIKSWKERKQKFVYELGGEEKEEVDRVLLNETEYRRLPDQVKSGMKSVDRVFLSYSFNNFGGLQTGGLEPLSDENLEIFSRFGKVFDLTYTRFNDLKQAEAQAREAQIQLALERVRARTMAMQSSEELSEVSFLLNKQVVELGIPTRGCAFNIYNEHDSTEWFANLEGTIPVYKTPRENIFLKYYETGRRGETLLIEEFGGERIKEHYKYLATLPVSGKKDGPIASVENAPAYQIDHVAYFKYGYLLFITLIPAPEAHEVFKRFAKEFEQTYTRFLDLKKAETQAMEARIEASLEKIRSRALAMRNSSEVGNVSTLLFSELEKMDINPSGFSIMIFDEKQDKYELWRAKEVAHQGAYETFSIKAMYDKLDQYVPGFSEELKSSWTKGKPFFVGEFRGKKRFSFIQANREMANYSDEEFEKMKKMFPNPIFWQLVFFKYGWFGILQNKQLPEDDLLLIQRFAEVFGFAFTRFLDLQKAETQAREAQVETALERVRSRTMGMQRSDELQDAALLLFQQIQGLGLPPFACGFNIWDDDRKAATAWMGGVVGLQPPFKTDSSRDVYLPIYEAAQRGEALFVKEQSGKELEVHYDYLATIPIFRDIILEGWKQAGVSAPTFQIIHCAYFTQGYLMFISFEPVPAYYLIFKRFAKVFEQTYTRFLDLQKAEAQTREAVKQSSLDRVRGQIASMRTTKDLERITPIIWHELNSLDVPFIRCGVFIVDEEQSNVQVYLTTPEVKPLAVLNLSFDSNELTSNTVDHWRKGMVYREHWNKEQFIQWAQSMLGLGQIHDQETYQGSENPPETLDLHFVPFAQGMLYVGNTAPLSDEKIQLVQALADAFSIAYARYEDFNKLEKAKASIESTLTELKATQSQLIQSEKMASLGELTAGIAHEIQNPLNFVNNFSEVSNELLDEMKTELDNGDIQEAKAIASDVKINLEKILHHGKRADAIVKGMLQHSRSSSGVKEPTDINALADEYLRLAYHGLRAKDKSFNSTLKTDFDETIGKIDIIPQDIGRVILNLITNAFFAVNERKQQQPDGYEPTVSVSTSRSLSSREGRGEVLISVKDNGPGIPQNIVDKIFQPFFTTKPTGSGTGLGLSLSYDIVKAHGGELKLETQEGEGTIFIIHLPKHSSL